MLSSPISRHFISLRTKYSPQHPVLKHPQSMLFNDAFINSNCIQSNGWFMVNNGWEREWKEVVVVELKLLSRTSHEWRPKKCF
jgi:hypothetical protein